MSEKFKPLFDAVIIEPSSIEETYKGTIIVPDLGKEKGLSGIVIAVGPGKYSVTGEHFIKTVVKVGDKVLLPALGPTKFDFEGKEYYICPEGQLLTIIL